LNPQHREEYAVWAREMDELAREMEGFLSIKTFVAEDGERVSVVEFAGWETLRARAHHPRHLEAQALERKRFYLEFWLQSGEVARESRFLAPS